MKTGTIEINSEANQVAENLALAFSVALLQVVCQPKYTPPASPECITVAVEATLPAASLSPEASTQERESPKEGQEPSCKEKDSTEADGQIEDGGKPAVHAAEEKPAEPVSAHQTPRSLSKSEPATPSKKMKEIPPIPVHDLALVMAAGYAIDTPSSENIKKIFGANACAGCVAIGMDVGIGFYSNVTADAQAESEAADAVEPVDWNDAADGNNAMEPAEAEIPLREMEAAGRVEDVADGSAAGS